MGELLAVEAGAGLGDDLMVLWACAGAARAGLVPAGQAVTFQGAEVAALAAAWAPALEPLRVVAWSEDAGCRRFTRSGRRFQWVGAVAWASALAGPDRWSFPYAHKWRGEFGNDWADGRRLGVARALGLVRYWDGGYPPVYDGWQEVAVATGLAPDAAREGADALAGTWAGLRADLATLGDPPPRHEGPLLFPGGGSFQSLPSYLVRAARAGDPALRVARFADDPEEADLRYGSLAGMVSLVRGAPRVVTSDSVASHAAQLLGAKHLLVASRSRPGNVVFPGAGATKVLDLGAALPCRPCKYASRDAGTCAAGHDACLAFAGGGDAPPHDRVVAAVSDFTGWLPPREREGR